MTNQTKIAKTIGASQGSVSNWLKGTHKPHPMFLKQLEELFPEDLKKMEVNYDKNRRIR